MNQADIGLIGLAVMGENLVLNMASHGIHVAVYNRTTSRVDEFLSGRAQGQLISGVYSLSELISKLKKPRRVMLMVQAGTAVDSVIEELIPLLDNGDIIIDGGNSNYRDTIRRTTDLNKKNLLFIGTGVSGGEEGALKGPSIMPGGNSKAWPFVRDIFQSIAAKVETGDPCCEWVGDGGAGHYVKMIHNGIEYGDMQMICEAYHILRQIISMEPDEMANVFSNWNKSELDSYLIEITADILNKKDEESGKPMIDLILDTAGQKGTGKWTGIDALQLGAVATAITEAVYSRSLSALKEERVAASKILNGPQYQPFNGARDGFVDDVKNALFASKICSYAQGFQLLSMAAAENGWSLNYGNIALMWRGGCIIRAQFLDRIKDAFEKDNQLPNLLVAPYFQQAIENAQNSWRNVIAKAVTHGVPVPAFSSALAYFDGYRSAQLPANLLQAQRDYFGAHTYERSDKERGQFFHTNWTGQGGDTASSAYNV